MSYTDHIFVEYRRRLQELPGEEREQLLRRKRRRRRRRGPGEDSPAELEG